MARNIASEAQKYFDGLFNDLMDPRLEYTCHEAYDMALRETKMRFGGWIEDYLNLR